MPIGNNACVRIAEEDEGKTPEGIAMGLRLRAAREASGLTQHDLARESGVAQGLISKIEGGRRTQGHISADVLERLAAKIGVTAEHLRTGAAAPSRTVTFDQIPQELTEAMGARPHWSETVKQQLVVNTRFRRGRESVEWWLRQGDRLEDVDRLSEGAHPKLPPATVVHDKPGPDIGAALRAKEAGGKPSTKPKKKR